MKNQPHSLISFLIGTILLFCLISFPLSGCKNNSVSPSDNELSKEKYFNSPEELAKAVFAALQTKNSQQLKSLVPTNKELQDWFDREETSDKDAISKQEELLKASNKLLNEDAQEMYDEMQTAGIKNVKIKEITHEVMDKYFYKEADIYIMLDNNCKIKLTDCVKTDKGWVFIRKANFIKPE